MGHGAVSKASSDYNLRFMTIRNTISIAIYGAGTPRRIKGVLYTHFRAVRE